MASISFIVEGFAEHKFSGGMWCILEYAHGLRKRGHEVSIVPIFPSLAPLWFPHPYGELVTRVKRETRRRIVNSACAVASCALHRDGNWRLQFKRAVSDLMIPNWRAFGSPVRSALSEIYLQQIAPVADIVVATSAQTARPAALLSGRKFYFAQHFEPIFCNEFDEPHYAESVARQSYCLGFEIIANSSWLRNILRQEVKNAVVHLCPNAIDHSIFFGTPKQQTDPRKIKIISYGGRRAEWKGFREMAKAMAIARSQSPDVEIEWQVYGDALLPPNNSIANYTPLGFLAPTALAEAYRSADILLSASWSESFPLFPIEAMACGLPVITTPLGTEEYALSGETAEVVQPKSPSSIADGLLKLIRDPAYAQRIAYQGNQVSKNFNWDSSVARLESILTSSDHFE